MVSLDLLVASSVAAMAILLALASVRASQSYFLYLAGYQNRSFREISSSQEMAAALDSSNANLSTGNSISKWMSSSQGTESSLEGLGNLSECAFPLTICRLVTLSGSTYLLVVSDENSSES